MALPERQTPVYRMGAAGKKLGAVRASGRYGALIGHTQAMDSPEVMARLGGNSGGLP